jgi:hypothetical protein
MALLIFPVGLLLGFLVPSPRLAAGATGAIGLAALVGLLGIAGHRGESLGVSSPRSGNANFFRPRFRAGTAARKGTRERVAAQRGSMTSLKAKARPDSSCPGRTRTLEERHERTFLPERPFLVACGWMQSSLVMEAGLQDNEVVAVDEVDQSVFFAGPSRPGAGQHVA